MKQSTKLLLQLGVFFMLALAVGGYAYFGVFKKDQASARQKDHDLRLFAPQKLDEKQTDGGSPPAQFTRVVVSFDGQTTELEREDGAGWKLVKPVRAKADALVMDALISQLQTAKFKDTLDEHPDEPTLKKYGLDAPRFVVTATAVVNGEARSVKLVGGAENTFDGSIFVQRDDQPAVYAAPGGVRRLESRTTRTGSRPFLTSRTVSRGSSASRVPTPTSTASRRLRSSCTSRRASSPVIHFDSPFAVATRPSRVAAALSSTNGRCWRAQV